MRKLKQERMPVLVVLGILVLAIILASMLHPLIGLLVFVACCFIAIPILAAPDTFCEWVDEWFEGEDR